MNIIAAVSDIVLPAPDWLTTTVLLACLVVMGALVVGTVPILLWRSSRRKQSPQPPGR